MVNHGQGPSNPACTRPGCARGVRAARIKTKCLATQFGNGKRPACEAPVERPKKMSEKGKGEGVLGSAGKVEFRKGI